jgi:hypothetical protein
VSFPRNHRALIIEELNIHNSVSKQNLPDVCVPDHFMYLTGRLNVGNMMKETLEEIEILNKAIGRFGSSGESTLTAGYRRCEKTDGSCTFIAGAIALSEVITLTGAAAKARVDTILVEKLLMPLIERITIHIQSLPSKHSVGKEFSILNNQFGGYTQDVTNRWTGNNPDSQDTDKLTNEYMKIHFLPITFSSPPWRILFDSEVETGTLQIEPSLTPASRLTPLNLEKIATEFEKIRVRLLDAIEFYKQVFKLLDKPTRSYLNTELFPYRRWLKPMLKITSENLTTQEYQEMEFYQYLVENVELTSTIGFPPCDYNMYRSSTYTANSCRIQIQTILPAITKMTRFERFEIQSHPIQKDGRWIQLGLPTTHKHIHHTFFQKYHLQPPDFKDRIFDNKYYQYPDDEADQNKINCHDYSPALPCQMCLSMTALLQVTNETDENSCLLQAIKFTTETGPPITLPPCDSIEVTQPEGLTLFDKKIDSNHTETTAVFTGLSEVTVIESCPNETEKSRKMPSSARLTIRNPACILKFINLDRIQEIAPYLNIVRLSFDETKKYIQSFRETFDQNFGQIRDHFNSHGYIYVIVILSLIALIILTIVLCLLGKYSARVWNQHRRPRQHISLQEQTSTRPFLREISPPELAQNVQTSSDDGKTSVPRANSRPYLVSLYPQLSLPQAL